jgi:Zn-finger protein
MKEETCGEIRDSEDGTKTWSCTGCIAVHQPEIAMMIVDALMKGEKMDCIWRKVERSL